MMYMKEKKLENPLYCTKQIRQAKDNLRDKVIQCKKSTIKKKILTAKISYTKTYKSSEDKKYSNLKTVVNIFKTSKKSISKGSDVQKAKLTSSSNMPTLKEWEKVEISDLISDKWKTSINQQEGECILP